MLCSTPATSVHMQQDPSPCIMLQTWLSKKLPLISQLQQAIALVLQNQNSHPCDIVEYQFRSTAELGPKVLRNLNLNRPAQLLASLALRFDGGGVASSHS